MKLIHLSDLHLGKRVNEFSMLEDQVYILKKILNIIDEEKPQGVIIAGDVYDKAVPPTEAVELLDDFLVSLSKRGLQVFLISGNHDSAERMAFGSRLIETSGIHMAPVYDGKVKPITLQDEYGSMKVFMLPFIKPAHVRRWYPEEEINSYTDAMRVALAHMDINPKERNVLVTHQFVTGATRSESEDISVGGTDNIDAAVFQKFDYVALGHIHAPQNIGGEAIRYSGTPLKYSFSEVSHQKSLTVLELFEKGNQKVRMVPLVPKRDMIELKGTYEQLTYKGFYEGTTYCEDYAHITLTDEEDIPDAMGKLRIIYHNLMKLDYDNKRTQSSTPIIGNMENVRKSPLELFKGFYELQNNGPMSTEQEALVRELIERIWEEENS